jgi:hypothetical protein
MTSRELDERTRGYAIDRARQRARNRLVCAHRAEYHQYVLDEYRRAGIQQPRRSRR